MTKIIELIGAPTTFGQKKLGVYLGPDAIRYAGVLPRLKAIVHHVIDSGNVEAPKLDIENSSRHNKDFKIMMRSFLSRKHCMTV